MGIIIFKYNIILKELKRVYLHKNLFQLSGFNLFYLQKKASIYLEKVTWFIFIYGKCFKLFILQGNDFFFLIFVKKRRIFTCSFSSRKLLELIYIFQEIEYYIFFNFYLQENIPFLYLGATQLFFFLSHVSTFLRLFNCPSGWVPWVPTFPQFSASWRTLNGINNPNECEQ